MAGRRRSGGPPMAGTGTFLGVVTSQHAASGPARDPLAARLLPRGSLALDLVPQRVLHGGVEAVRLRERCRGGPGQDGVALADEVAHARGEPLPQLPARVQV